MGGTIIRSFAKSSLLAGDILGWSGFCILQHESRPNDRPTASIADKLKVPVWCRVERCWLLAKALVERGADVRGADVIWAHRDAFIGGKIRIQNSKVGG